MILKMFTSKGVELTLGPQFVVLTRVLMRAELSLYKTDLEISPKHGNKPFKIGENGFTSSTFYLKGTIPNQRATLTASALGLTPAAHKVAIGSIQ